MSASKFNGKVILSSTSLTDISPTPGSKLKWAASFSFSDASGVYLGSSVPVGAAIVLDTSASELGTITSYVITRVVSATFNSFRVEMEYIASNGNPAGPPDILLSSNLDGYVGSRSANRGLISLTVPNLQRLPESLTYQVLNDNLFNILDSTTTTAAVLGGSAGQIVYQSAVNVSAFTAVGTIGQVLTSNGTGTPTWVSPSALTITTAGNLSGGAAGQVHYQSAANVSAFTAAGTAGQVLTSNGAGAPTWTTPTATATTAAALSGGAAGQVHYQSAPNVTAFTAAGTAGQVLTVSSTGVPTWTTPAATATTATNILGGAVGSIHYQSAPNATAFTAAGSPGLVLSANSAGIPTWVDLSVTSTALRAYSLSGGAAGQVHYQSAVNVSAFTAAGTAGQVLTSSGAGAPTWTTPSATATTAAALSGGAAGQIHYQSAPNVTAFLPRGGGDQVLSVDALGVPKWVTWAPLATYAQNAANVTGGNNTGLVLTSVNATTSGWASPASLSVGFASLATSLAGAPWAIPYQSATNTTSMLPAGVAGQVLKSNGSAAPSWQDMTATTQPVGTANTTIATTAFVDRLRSSRLTATLATAAITDRGNTISLTAAGLTIPANVFASGDVFSVYNNTGGDVTLASGPNLTLWLVGTNITGARTLAQRGLATIYYISAIEAVITGGGLN